MRRLTASVCVLPLPPTSTTGSAWGATNPEIVFPLLHLVFTFCGSLSHIHLVEKRPGGVQLEFPRIAYFHSKCVKIVSVFKDYQKRSSRITFCLMFSKQDLFMYIIVQHQSDSHGPPIWGGPHADRV